MAKKNPMQELLQTENTFPEIFEKRAQYAPNKRAITFHDHSFTFKEINDKANSLATAFLKMGLSSADRIAFILPTRPEFIIAWLAASKIGATIVGLSIRYQKEEVINMIGSSNASTIICINEAAGNKYSDFISAIRPQIPSVKNFIFLGQNTFPDAISFDDLMKQSPDMDLLKNPRNQVKPENDNFIIFTSGTTGQPKGAVLTHKSILAMLKGCVPHMNWQQDDKLLMFLPLNHVGGGTGGAMVALASGAELVLHDTFDVDAFLRIIDKHKITRLGGVPTVYELMFAIRPDITPDMVSSLKSVVWGGAPATPEIIKKMKDVFQCAILSVYGATETSGYCSFSSENDPFDKCITAGKPSSTAEIKIFDLQSRKEVKRGDVGEICVKSDMNFSRYLNMPKETAESVVNGWYYTGDLGYFDPEGYLVISGRVKEMIITGGFNVYPKEVEDKLSHHPAVSTASVVGIPDKVKGELGVAFIIPKPGETVTESELREFCKTKMTDYKIPARIFFEQMLPMTTVGKVQKVKLKEMAISRISAGQ